MWFQCFVVLFFLQWSSRFTETVAIVVTYVIHATKKQNIWNVAWYDNNDVVPYTDNLPFSDIKSIAYVAPVNTWIANAITDKTFILPTNYKQCKYKISSLHTNLFITHQLYFIMSFYYISIKKDWRIQISKRWRCFCQLKKTMCAHLMRNRLSTFLSTKSPIIIICDK